MSHTPVHMHQFLHPRSIAIVGASRNPEKVGNIVIQNLIDAGYTGDIYPINPKAKEIHGFQVYPEINKTPQTPELCIISLPTSLVIQELEQAIDAGCMCFVIYTAGFKEIGEEGKKIEEQLAQIAHDAGVTLLGPNCLGFLHTPSKVNASFAQAHMTPGNLRIVSQSGAVASALFDRAQAVSLRFETCVTIGNKAVLDETHFLSWWTEQQDHTGPIGLYLEEISNGDMFMKYSSELTQQGVPLILLKPGSSAAAQHAMQSHTGSIAGEDAVLDAVTAQCGIMRVKDMESLFGSLLYHTRQPAPKGNRVAIITNAGGPGVVTTDLIEATGLCTAQLSEETKQTIAAQLPRAASVLDPIDVLGDAQADRYAAALEAVMKDSADVDAIVVLLTPQIMTQIEETARVIAAISKKHTLPIVCAFVGQHDVYVGKKILRQHEIPCYAFPRQAVAALGRAYQRGLQAQKLNHVTAINKEDALEDQEKELFAQSKSGLLDVNTTMHLLDDYSIPVPQTTLCTTVEQAQAFATAFSFPVVLKLTGPKLLHKIDIGGVITDIKDTQDLDDQRDRIALAKATLEDTGQEVHIQVQQQIEDGIECILGMKRDPQFGTVLLFGAGGTYAELWGDHRLAVLPTSRAVLQEMVEESPLAPLLAGYRGKQGISMDILLDIIESFATMVLDNPRIQQAEINPLIATPNGVWAVDPKIVIG